MKTHNHPNWLVPLDIARKLTEIGMTGSEIFIYNDGSYGWCKSEQMYDRDRSGDTYTAEEIYEFGDSKMEYTYTWEQVFEWFRNKDLFVYVDKLTLAKNKEIYKFYVKGISNIISDGFSSYEEARRALINKLIELYGGNKNN